MNIAQKIIWYRTKQAADIEMFRKNILNMGFHPSVANEQIQTYKLLGPDKALQGVQDLIKRYPNAKQPGSFTGSYFPSPRETYTRQLQTQQTTRR